MACAPIVRYEASAPVAGVSDPRPLGGSSSLISSLFAMSATHADYSDRVQRMLFNLRQNPSLVGAGVDVLLMGDLAGEQGA